MLSMRLTTVWRAIIFKQKRGGYFQIPCIGKQKMTTKINNVPFWTNVQWLWEFPTSFSKEMQSGYWNFRRNSRYLNRRLKTIWRKSFRFLHIDNNVRNNGTLHLKKRVNQRQFVFITKCFRTHSVRFRERERERERDKERNFALFQFKFTPLLKIYGFFTSYIYFILTLTTAEESVSLSHVRYLSHFLVIIRDT